MSEVLEIRWHGRGGQGAKTAALLFGEAALDTGQFIQAFPEYGPERTGAPVAAYNRLSKKPIRIHSGIKNPDIVVVLDPSLIEPMAATEGIKPGGVLLVNTTEKPDELRRRFNIRPDIKVWTVDASRIALETIGKDLPNTPMLGALVKVTGILDYEATMKAIEHKLSTKFRDKKLVEKNLASVRRAFEEVQG
ncbi:MAG: 2-oxoacid:acceptor oxidoreductase family protein [candidate division WOR-3 bacterium]